MGFSSGSRETIVDNDFADRKDLTLPTVVTTVDRVVETVLRELEQFEPA